MLNNDYQQLLESKIKIAENTGFEISDSDINPMLFPHQRDIVRWALNGGRRAIFASFGLGKTFMQLEIARLIIEETQKPFMIGLPLGVKHEFILDAEKLGIRVKYVRDMEEFVNDGLATIYLSNYERIREGNFDPDAFGGICFDEASILRGLDTQTSDYILSNFMQIKYRFVATATPSPNEYTEILNYAHFLGIMDRGQALTRFFQRDSQKAGNLTIHKNREKEFWMWVSSWALFITKPSDLGYDDAGYEMPDMIINEHRISVTDREIKPDKNGQVKAFANAAASLQDSSREKRESLPDRLSKMQEIVNESPDDNFLIWHHLEKERAGIENLIPEAKTVYGSQDMETREDYLIGFGQGKYKYLATKPRIAGSGCNFQRYCHRAIYTGIDYKFNDFIQSVHRIYRFLQNKQVIIDLIYTDAEDQVYKTLMAKWTRHNEMVKKMTDYIKEFGLSNASLKADLSRHMEINRQETKGSNFHLIHNDSVLETANMADSSIDLVVTSIPFSDQYEYSENYADMGHNNGDDEFFEQLGYLTRNLLRITKPGRVACIHVKDRIRYSYQNGQGFTSMSDFSGKTVAHFEKHGWHLLGKHTITTDVVRENNQTYRLGWTEQCKDASKMGSGLPEYLLVFRKTPTDTSNGYADNPVTKTKETYSRASWQIDAHAYWKSNGNRLLNSEELRQMDLGDVLNAWKAYESENIYDHATHVQICEELDEVHRLPSTFMAVPPQSINPFIWDDVNRMNTLNTSQTKRKQEKHVCPLQFDIIDRCIIRYSNEGEKVFDPFGGIGSVPFRAIKLNRYGISCELNEQYYKDSIRYCKEAEYKASVPSLFDAIEVKPLLRPISELEHELREKEKVA
jgi:DNA modification methylase